MKKYLFLSFFLSVSLFGSDLLLEPSPDFPDRVQVASWLREDLCLAGWWDSTITLFSNPPPLFLQATPIPSSNMGVQMLASLDGNFFVSSHDQGSLALWEVFDQGMHCSSFAFYPTIYGVANSSLCLDWQGVRYLISGHEKGYIILWKWEGKELIFSGFKDIRSSNSLPLGLYNVRGIAHYKDELVVTGAEDGDLCLLSIPDLTIIDRKKYNKSAERGINTVSVVGEWVLAGNCPMSVFESNLWRFRIENQTIVPVDSTRLAFSPNDPVFLFSMVPHPESNGLFATTEEGLIWHVHLSDELEGEVFSNLGSEGAAALALYPGGKTLVAAAITLHFLSIEETENLMNNT